MNKTELTEQLKDNDLSLEEKLALIDQAMFNAQAEAKKSNVDAPVDPMEDLLCFGCQ